MQCPCATQYFDASPTVLNNGFGCTRLPGRTLYKGGTDSEPHQKCQCSDPDSMIHRRGRGVSAVWTTLLVLFVGLLVVVAVEEKAPEVCAKVGCVTGVNKSGGSRRAYEAFLGLPYARPPTNRYRWQVTRVNI